MVKKTREQLAQESLERAKEYAALYRYGLTLQQIGDHYGITREAVRQFLGKLNINWKDGGAHAGYVKRQSKKQAERDAACLQRHGCSYQEYKELTGMGINTAYRRQKGNAKFRGIEWKLSLKTWWEVWQASGKWDKRGRGDGYVMARYGDTGPYSIENVHIVHAVENILEYHEPTNQKKYHNTRKKWGLDYDPNKLMPESKPKAQSEHQSKYKGVSWNKKQKRWRAYRYVNGKQQYLGTFTSEEQAAQAVRSNNEQAA